MDGIIYLDIEVNGKFLRTMKMYPGKTVSEVKWTIRKAYRGLSSITILDTESISQVGKTILNVDQPYKCVCTYVKGKDLLCRIFSITINHNDFVKHFRRWQGQRQQ